MTSKAGVDEVVERYLFHGSSCGEAMESGGKKETCPIAARLSRSLGVLRPPTAITYRLRLRVNKRPRNTEPLLWPLVSQPMAPTHPLCQPHEAPLPQPIPLAPPNASDVAAVGPLGSQPRR
jgi:hypothetical protein